MSDHHQAASILVVDDDLEAARVMADVLRTCGHDIDVVTSSEACLCTVNQRDYDIVITDHRMGGILGTELCEILASRYPDVATILMSAHSTVDLAVDSLRAGVYDFLIKPVGAHTLADAVKRTTAYQRSRNDVRRLRDAKARTGSIEGLVGKSRHMVELVAMIRRAAPSDATALITGPSGCGKELVARALHHLSSRSTEPFLAINCGAMTPTLLESELFGHEAGAFTHATSRVGLFVQARRGTVFLDEIGEMPHDMQVKLLRVLQERRVRRVGSDTELSFDARVVAATNRDLATEVTEGRFREDLFHRLNVLPIPVPALRDRQEDILPLAEHVLARIAERTRSAIAALAPEVVRRLLAYPWPGNVRELENSLERAVAVAGPRALVVADLPPKVRDYTSVPGTIDVTQGMVPLTDFTRGYVRRVLEDMNGNKAKAARMLGITRRSLYRRI